MGLPATLGEGLGIEEIPLIEPEERERMKQEAEALAILWEAQARQYRIPIHMVIAVLRERNPWEPSK